MTLFSCFIYERNKPIFKDEVNSLMAPAQDGYVGILANHAPMFCILQSGEIILKKGEEVKTLPIQGGIMEVFHNQTTILIF